MPLTPDYPTFIAAAFTLCPSTTEIDNYFAGRSPDYPAYTAYTASLANWAGGEVRLRFHLSGELFLPGGNWWVDDINVTQAITPGACTSLPIGPPPIPDGAAVPGAPLMAGPAAGGQVSLTWDAARCPAAAVNLYYGSLGSFTSFTGGVCNLPPTGAATVTLPNNVWFLVASTDGASTDGSYSRDLAGAEIHYGGASLACPAITQHVTNNGCP